MKFVDAHIHLSDSEYSQELDHIIDNAKRSNVVAVVSNSMDFQTSILSIRLSKNYPGFVYSAIGIHPWSVGHLEPNEIQKVVRLIVHPKEQDGKIVAVGEIGLDYTYSKTKGYQDLQRKVFHEMLRAAEKTSLPVIIHSRGTAHQILTLLNSYQLKGVLLHWFSQPSALLGKIIDHGYYISEGPPSLFSRKIREIIRQVPLTHLLTETDGPVHYHGPFEGKMTTPSFIPQIVKAIAELKGKSETDVASQILQNFVNFFRMPLV